MDFKSEFRKLGIPENMLEAAAAAYGAIFEEKELHTPSNDVIDARKASRKETLTEAAGDNPGGLLRMVPGWPEKDMETDFSENFARCPYAKEFFDRLKERLSQFGTIVFDKPILVGDDTRVRNKKYEPDLKMAKLVVTRGTRQDYSPYYLAHVYVPYHGDRVAPFNYKEIGSIANPGNNFDILSRLYWRPWVYTGVNQERFNITSDNIDEAVERIAGYVQEFIDKHPIDTERADMETDAHYRWLSRRAKNLTDIPVGKMFVEKFNELAEGTPEFDQHDYWQNRDYKKHLVGACRSDRLNGVGVNAFDLFFMQAGKDGKMCGGKRAYTVRCTSDGAVALIGNWEDLDYGTVMLTENNWEEVCVDVFKELVAMGKQEMAESKVLAQKEAERQSRRVMSDRNRIRNKFGDYIYKKFFDVVDDGELAGKSTDEIITDMKCAIAEDRAEYDLMAKKDSIRAGK